MKISIREFQRHPVLYINKLATDEVILTQYNLPIAKIVPVTSPAPQLSPDTSVRVIKDREWQKVETSKCDMPFCKQSAIGTFKVSTYSTDTGEEEKTLHLCAWHKGKATKEGNIQQL
jgi:antitoxin (DNA-binding transcriptional repressor) of toxin-antitoxin stability system